MGLTFIAAGVSVPDALAGVAVVKEGHGEHDINKFNLSKIQTYIYVLISIRHFFNS